jgi:hypothetical protein
LHVPKTWLLPFSCILHSESSRTKTHYPTNTILIRASPASSALSMWPCENIIISHFQVLVIFFFATPTMKLKLGHSKQISAGEY